MVDLSLSRFEQRLRAVRGRTRSRFGPTAAVAAVLRYERAAPDVLLMRRVTREGDPWSGHVSFPGGRAEPDDPDLVATAVRETREELGIDLGRGARLLGRLRPLRTLRKDGLWPMTIVPFVFVQHEPQPVVPGPEAVTGFWLPLDRAAAGDLSDVYEHRIGPLEKRFPCWRHEGHVVWGLTYRMLADLIATVMP